MLPPLRIFGILVLAFVSSMLVIVGVITHQSQASLQVSRQWVIHSHQVIEEMERALYSLERAQAEYTRFLYTGNSAIASSCLDDMEELKDHLALLKQLTTDSPEQEARVGSLMVAVNTRIAHLEENIARYNAASTLRDNSQIVIAESRAEHEKIVALLNHLSAAEESLLAARTVKLDIEGRHGQQQIELMLCLIMLVLAVAAYVVIRSAKVSQAAEYSARIRERESAQSRLHLDAVLSSVAEGIVQLDPSGRILYMNAGAERISGWKLSEIQGRAFDDLLVSPSMESSSLHWMEQLEKTGSIEERGILFRKKDGKVFTAHLVANSLTLEGAPDGIVISFSDITAVKTREDMRRTQVKVSRILFESEDVADALSDLLRAICHGLNYEHGIYWRVNQDLDILELGFVYSTVPDDHDELLKSSSRWRFPKGFGLPGHVWEKRELTWWEELLTEEHFRRIETGNNFGWRSAVAFPIRVGDKIIGIFEMISKHSKMRDDDHLNMLQGLVNQIELFLERRYAEENLRRAEQLLRAVFDQTFQFMGVLSPEGILLQSNATALIFVDADAETVVGKPFWETPWWTHDPLVQQQCKAAVAAASQGEFVRFETTHHGPFGNVAVDFSLKPIYDNEGNIVLLLPEGRDITEMKRAQYRLMESEKTFRQLAENIREVFWISEPAFKRFIYVSPAFEDVWGIPSQMLIAEPEIFWQTIHEEDREKVRVQFEQSSDYLQGIECEYRIVRSDNKHRWVMAKTFPVFDNEGHFERWCGIVRDVTERKEIERRVSEFYSTVSHELRTPLTSIRGSLGLIQGGLAGEIPETAMHLIDIARSESDRLIRLINDILDLQKIEAGKLTLKQSALEVDRLVCMTVDGLSGYAAECGIVIDSEVPPDLWIFGDQDRIVQVLTNLVSNAIKFSQQGSTVRIVVEKKAAECCRFSIHDSGEGIHQDDLDKLFSKFQQVDSSDTRQRGGTGLGLAISRAIVEQHGGAIGVISSPGEGSVFWFEIPLPPPAYKAQEPMPERYGFDRILALTHNDHLYELMQKTLGKDGFLVSRVTSPGEGIQAACEQNPCALIVDLDNDDGQFLELIRDLRSQARTKNVPVLLLSPDSSLPEGYSEPLLVDFLHKPFVETDLLKMVNLAVRKNGQGKARVLIIEDDKPTRELLARQLEQMGVEFFEAEDGRQALSIVRQAEPDLIILDVGIPYPDGFDVVKILRAEKAATTPLIVYTCRDLTDEDMQDLRLGLTRYFIKSRTSDRELFSAVRELLKGFLETESPSS